MIPPNGSDRGFPDSAQRSRREHVARGDHAVVMHRQFDEHAAAGREITHFPARGFAAGGFRLLHFPEHAPQCQRTGRSLDPPRVVPVQSDQGPHGLHPLLRGQHNRIAMGAAGSHRHGVIGADPSQADVVQQQSNGVFQIPDVMRIHGHAGRGRQPRLFQHPQPADRLVETALSPGGVMHGGTGTVDGNLDGIQPLPD